MHTCATNLVDSIAISDKFSLCIVATLHDLAIGVM